MKFMKMIRSKFIFTLLWLCSGCQFFAKESLPYLIDAEMTMDSSNIYEIAGLDFTFMNKSNKSIKSFTIVFYLFDEDGNPPSLGNNNLVIQIDSVIQPSETMEDCFSLDSFLYEIPDCPYQLDYLYVSRIEYEDGSVWSDPLGAIAFR